MKTIDYKQWHVVKSMLHNLYHDVPETEGCLDCISDEKHGCKGWCCKIQSPHVLYCEFLNAWKFVLKHWEQDEIVALVRAALTNYFADTPTKGCIFFDNETRLCTIHTVRPLSCRVYGITPEEEFKPKYERIKKEYEGHLMAVVRDQCDKVKTVDGREVTTEDTSDWWERSKLAEKKLGIHERDIHDGATGTYHTYHDHLLLQLLGSQLMENISIMRQYGDRQQKNNAIEVFIEQMKEFLLKENKDVG